MLFRAFYALPKSIKGPDGNPVNALLGSANLILREVETHNPRAVVLCFGPDAAAYRLELFPAYHADREAAFPDELRPQWKDSADFFGAFGWKIATSETLEADDLLGSLAAKELRAGGRSLLMTGDRDMFQCASGSTKVLYVSTGKQGGQPMGPAEVEKRYGIPPKLVPDLIALRGDPSDGIPGAKGVGEKTAVELLRRHGSLEKVLDAAIRETRPALRVALVGDRDQLLAIVVRRTTPEELLTPLTIAALGAHSTPWPADVRRRASGALIALFVDRRAGRHQGPLLSRLVRTLDPGVLRPLARALDRVDLPPPLDGVRDDVIELARFAQPRRGSRGKRHLAPAVQRHDAHAERARNLALQLSLRRQVTRLCELGGDFRLRVLCLLCHQRSLGACSSSSLIAEFQ